MQDREGQQLGNYRLVRLLGQGGFAHVYLGEHIHLRTLAAVKVLDTRMSGSDESLQFRHEARVIADLHHPNIVRVLDFSVIDNTPFLVMEYAPNGTLAKRHPRGIPLPPMVVVSYVKQVAAALQYAHTQKRLIHLDVKPANMLLGSNDEILLSDFGIALTAISSRSQAIENILGTLPYMSPEHLNGKPSLASDRPDARIGPAGPEVGIEPDHQIDLDRRPAEGLERLRAEQIVLDAEEEAIHRSARNFRAIGSTTG